MILDAFFTASAIGARMQIENLSAHLIAASRRWFGMPVFRYCAIADDMREVCAGSPCRVARPPERMPQLAFCFP